MQTLTFLGCGKTGRALGRRWAQAKVFAIGQVLTRSPESAQAAVAFLGAGQAINDFAGIEPADAFFLAAPDDALSGMAKKLAATGMIMEGAICWHASGAIPSSVLKPLRDAGAEIGSIHPAKSFADPASAAETFGGTPCVIEGMPEACQLLSEACRAIGGVPIQVTMSNRDKAVYHAGTTLASNCLVALAEVAVQCLEQAGFQRQQAIQLLGPLMAGSIQNVTKLGTTDALTGPISRGEVGTVARHLAALEGSKPIVVQSYRLLGQLIVDLARKQEQANQDTLNTIQELLR
ncbi:MAG TPA: DUF2520 domain-containing protein [Gemmatales bacterium]|nr:DUF2520 domain-containing protein [Gemmatales bacterium]